MSLLDRYRSGEHEAVYDELVSSGAPHEDALPVAVEMMHRVRCNLEVLANRWRGLDFTLGRPIGEPSEIHDAVRAVEQRIGPLIPTLKAFYQVIGWVSFVEEPPGDPWPDIEELDPIAFLHPADQLEALSELEDEGLPLILDPLTKFEISGSGPIYTPLPLSGFDAELWFESHRLYWPDGVALHAGEPFRLVPYLREAVLRRGGIGPCGASELDDRLVRELTRGLSPF